MKIPYAKIRRIAVPRDSFRMLSEETLVFKEEIVGTIKLIVAGRRSIPHVAAVDGLKFLL